MTRHPTPRAPVVCLHGFPGLPTDWDPLAAALRHPREVLSIPMPWLSGSAAPLRGFRGVLDHVAATLRGTLAAPVHFVGHDLGAVALFWLARTPFLPAMKSVTLIAAPHPAAYRDFMATAASAPHLGYIDAILAEGGDDALRRTLLASAAAAAEDGRVADRIAAGLAATDFAALRALYREIKAPPPRGPLDRAGLTCPVALVHAADDRILPAGVMAESGACFGPDAPILRLPGQSHYPHLTAPAAVAEFLEDVWNAADTR